MFCSFHPLADKTNNKHLRKPFFKVVVRWSKLSVLWKGPGNGCKNKALWVIGLINMAVLARRRVYVDVVCELNNYT